MKKCIIILLLLLPFTLLYAKATIYHLNIDKRVTLKYDIFYYANKRGNPKAQYDLGIKYRDGINVPINLKRAFYYFHKAATQNYAPAQYQLGMAFRRGAGIKRNPELARYWIRKSAKNHFADAISIFKRYYSHKIPIRQFQFRTFASR
jgi:TPR repeat protein